MSTPKPPPDPTLVTIRDWCARTGMSRSETFEAMNRGDIPAFQPSPRKVLISLDEGLAWIKSKPRTAKDSP